MSYNLLLLLSPPPGHSMSDFMNVWTMLWLSGTALSSKSISFLNIDAIRMGHNYHDKINQFFMHYQLNFYRILSASQYPKGSKVCFKTLIFQPQPVLLFTWDGWWQDMKCSFIGPSSLFQRWNLQIRKNMKLLPTKKTNTHQEQSSIENKDIIKILFVVRKNDVGGYKYAQRVFGNEQELSDMLKKIPQTEVIVRDLADLSFSEQVTLISQVHILIGMHGAGIANSMHMGIGRPLCCGVVEIFPPGEFMPIRGYGNMARRMGHRYVRLELQETGGGKTIVSPEKLRAKVVKIIEDVKVQPSCVLPSTIHDPYFLN
jgi:hypothetical protein